MHHHHLRIWILSDVHTGKDKEIVWMDKNPLLMQDILLGSKLLAVEKSKGDSFSDKPAFYSREIKKNSYAIIDPPSILEAHETMKIKYKNKTYTLTKVDGYSYSVLL